MLLALVALFTTGCWDYEIALPHGWKLSQWSAGENVVLKPAPGSSRIATLVGPTVDRYQVVEHFVLGHVDALPDAVHYGFRSSPGYFIVDTATNRVWQGLDELAWRQQLRELGIAEEPQLHWPTRYDTQYAGR